MTPTGREVNEYAQVTDLFQRLAEMPADLPDYEQLRTNIIETCLPLAHHIARRYRGRGQTHEDLVQVASVGLVNAVNRFDLTKGKDFLSFAVPTMMGEVRKHFRDRGWDVRVPRSLQENYLALKKSSGLAHPNSRTRTHRSRTRRRTGHRTRRNREHRRGRRFLPFRVPGRPGLTRRSLHRRHTR